MLDYTLLNNWEQTQSEFPVQFKKDELALTIEEQSHSYFVTLTEPDETKMDGVKYHIEEECKTEHSVQVIIDRVGTKY